MKIHSLSKVLSLPLILLAGYFLVYEFNQSSYDSAWIFLPVVLLTMLFVFHGDIDHWWLEKHPIVLDEQIKLWLNKYSKFYQNLDDQQRAEYEKRLELYLSGREFKAVGTKENRDVPYDIRAAIASQGITMCFGLDDYLIGDLDRIYIYKHPFPSPTYQFLHTVESHGEDGMLILSLKHAIDGILNPKENYNITMHGYADAFIKIKKQSNLPSISEADWPTLETILGIKKERILKTMGFESISILPVHVVAFFEDKEAYAEQFPMKYNRLKTIFNQK